MKFLFLKPSTLPILIYFGLKYSVHILLQVPLAFAPCANLTVTNSMAYGNLRFNAEFARALQ
jgi:hypothetical protein